MKKSVLVLLMFMALISAALPESLWNEDLKSPYTAARAHKVGDIITIFIDETTRAAQSAGTNTSKRSSVEADMFSSWKHVASLLGTNRDDVSNGGGISAQDEYAGEGETSRRSSVRARISATVTQVLPNGNLYILGSHKVNVNEETETIVVAGIIRSSDITAQNAIYSSQIAEAQISVKGSGSVAAKQSPGILTKLFGWLF
ncbi:MAG: flagellar basal body L-ring protein FlgH [Candidatus Margulisiibacteriota bacterium]